MRIFDREHLIWLRAQAARARRMDLLTQIDELLERPPTQEESAAAELHAAILEFCNRLGQRMLGKANS